MTNEPTPTERVLSAEAAHLQNKLATQAQGGFWGFLTQIVPLPLVVLGMIVFGGYHGFKMHQTAQLEAARSQLKDADKGLQEAKAARVNARDRNGDTLAVAEAKAKLRAAQATALQARTEAEALESDADGQSLAAAKLQEDINKTEAEAALLATEAESRARHAR